jgi:ribosomal protein S18 acetylase RimI-like enzyme
MTGPVSTIVATNIATNIASTAITIAIQSTNQHPQNDSKISLRPATSHDIEAVWQMWKIIMEQQIYFPYTTEMHSESFIKEEWVHLRHPMYVACLDILIVDQEDSNDCDTTTSRTTHPTATKLKTTTRALPQTIVVGAFILRPNQPGYGSHICNAAYLVHHEHRRRGIGHLLTAQSIQTARNIGYRGMQFNLVLHTNTAAVTLWHTYGFSIVGTIPGGFYLQAQDRYVDCFIYFKSLLLDE